MWIYSLRTYAVTSFPFSLPGSDTAHRNIHCMYTPRISRRRVHISGVRARTDRSSVRGRRLTPSSPADRATDIYVSRDKHHVREQRSVSSAYDLARSNRGFSITHTSVIFYRHFAARLSSRESRIVLRISLDDVPWDRSRYTGCPRRFALGASKSS